MTLSPVSRMSLTEGSCAATLSGLSIEQRVGQMMMVSFRGPVLPPDAASFIAEAGIGGVLLFGDNVESPWQALELTSTLQACAVEAGLPAMLIAADQEGGSVSRFRYPIVVAPSPMAIGASGDPRNAALVAGMLASELRALGLNLNLSAMADVNTQARNPVIGTRAYGDSPDSVAAFVRAAIPAYHEHGVLVAAKHFPGHGGTTVDSHRELPVVADDLSRLREVELPPFVSAIDAGVDAILTAQVVYPALDASGLPATLSRRVLKDLLRDEMGFDGLVISDAIEMNAIARHYGQAQGAVLAAKAGVDVILTVGHLEEQRAIHRELLGAARRGELSEETVSAAAARVLQAKGAIALDASQPDSQLWPKNHHQRIARQVARESITVVRDDGNLLPLRLKPALRLGLIECRATRTSPVEERESGNILDTLIRGRHGNTASVLVDTGFPLSADELLGFASGCDLLVVATRNAVLDERQASLTCQVLQLEKPIVLLALRSPYDLLAFPAARCLLVSYGDQPCSLEAAVGVIFGDFLPSGKLPVRLSVL